MSHQDEWRTILTALKSAVMGFAVHGQSPENMGDPIKRFRLFVEGNKGWLRNDSTACAVVDAFNRSFALDFVPPLTSLPYDEALKRMEVLMDAIDQAISKICADKEPKTTNFIFHNPTISASQIGNNNVQNNSDQTYVLLAKAIDNGNGSPEEKAEAKTLLKKFLEHPIVSSIAGGIAGVLAG